MVAGAVFFFFLSGREEKEETEQEPTPDEVVRSEYPSQSEKEIPGKTKEKRRAKNLKVSKRREKRKENIARGRRTTDWQITKDRSDS